MLGQSQARLVERFTTSLTAARQGGFDPANVSALIDLEDGEEIDWIAQSYLPGRGMANVYCLRQPGQPDAFIATFSGDAGEFAGWLGPARSREDLENAIGLAPEGWTTLSRPGG